jgi:hypothetical protein
MKRTAFRAVAVAAAVAVCAVVALRPASRPAAAAEDDPALGRAREHVKMVDSLYKNAVVAVTDLYKEGPPAIMVAKRVFKAMREDGWHDTRLVDVTGNPLNEANVPATDFEKRAAEAIRAGQAYYEEVAGEGAERHLLAATVVPAVHRRCASCHGVDEGDLLGFLRYDVTVK